MESFPLFEGPAFYLGDGVLAHFAAQFVNDLFALCQKLLATGLDDAVALFVSLVLQFCFDLLATLARLLTPVDRTRQGVTLIGVAGAPGHCAALVVWWLVWGCFLRTA